MAKYALVDGDKITQVQVADSIDALGPLGLIFEVVDITGLDPEPSRGWERHDNGWCPPAVTDAAKALWTGAGFEAAEEEETKAVEAPKEEKKASK